MIISLHLNSGLDDLSCSQCVSLLRRIAHGGRTVICSVHTPSAKMFEMFDHVYILANGQCIYQGQGSNLIPYTQSIGLNCPMTHNPADFSKKFPNISACLTVEKKKNLMKYFFSLLVIDVATGEYGFEYIDKMISAVDNGRCLNWTPYDAINADNNYQNEKQSEQYVDEFEEEINPKHLRARSSFWEQFCILYKRRTLQMWRDSVC